MFKKEDIENRIKEIDGIIVQQGQLNAQINNNILMLHGAKEELQVWLKRSIEAEKINDQKESENVQQRYAADDQG